MGVLRAILLDSYILFRSNNKLVKPVIQPLTRLYTTVSKFIIRFDDRFDYKVKSSHPYIHSKDDKRPEDLKKEKKLAKKLAILAAEPQFFQDRSNKWTELKQKYDQEVAAKKQEIINVTLLDGKIVEGFSWELTPFDVAQGINHALASEVYLAKINNVLWDVERPLEMDCNIQLMKFDSQDAKAAFWTTAACTVAEALERLYCIEDGGLVCHVGSTQTGFYVDIQLKHKTVNGSSDFLHFRS